MTEPAVEIQDLEVVYRVRGIDRPVLRGLTLTVGKGESYGLVGESGCGKTTAAFTIMGYLPRNGRVVSGSRSWATCPGTAASYRVRSGPTEPTFSG